MTLKQRILDEIDREGPMTVARFMELALYDPEEGYYAAGTERAGEEWFTGPTLHPVYGWTLARGLAPLLAQCEDPTLVEAGTGSGQLARDLCYGLSETDPDTFARLSIELVDTSEAVLDRALTTLEDAGVALEDVHASTELPDAISGVLVTNELLDALPVHLFRSAETGVEEIYVVEGDPTLTLAAGEPSSPAAAEYAREAADGLPPGRLFEVPLKALDWYGRAANRLEQGAIVTVDYGADRAELLERFPKGTIHGYRQGMRVDEFFFDPGEMDVTYRVPFDQVAQAGTAEGLSTLVDAPQGEVLDRLGIRELAGEDARDKLAAKKLIDPSGAGSTFRVLVQTRGVDEETVWLGTAEALGR